MFVYFLIYNIKLFMTVNSKRYFIFNIENILAFLTLS